MLYQSAFVTCCNGRCLNNLRKLIRSSKELNETVSLLRKDVEAGDALVANLRNNDHILENANQQLQNQTVKQDSMHQKDNFVISSL